MIRHLTNEGNRKWYSDHLCELQSESLKAIDNLAAHFGACVLSGCEIYNVSGDNFRISDGLIVVGCSDRKWRVVPYSDDTVLTGFNSHGALVPSKTDIHGEYQNPINTVIAENWYSSYSGVPLADTPTRKAGATSFPRLSDKIKEFLETYYEPIFSKNTAFNRNFGQSATEVERGSNNPSGLKTRKIDIGGWDMVKYSRVSIDLSSYSITTLINVEASIIVKHVDTVPPLYYLLPLSVGGYWQFNENNEMLVLNRDASSVFLNYDELSENKGYIIITYI